MTLVSVESPPTGSRPARLDFLAILAGSITDHVLTILGGALLSSFLVGNRAAGLVFGLAMTAVGGYVAAAIAGRRILAHALGVGILSTVIGLVLRMLRADNSPVWYQVLGYGLTIPAAILGGYVRRRYWREKREIAGPLPGVYPSIRQAIGLLLLTLFILIVLSVAAGAIVVLAVRGHPYVLSWGFVAVLAAFVAGYGLVMLWGIRKARAPVGELFPLRLMRGAVLWPIIPTIAGAAILLSEVTNLLLRMHSTSVPVIDLYRLLTEMKAAVWALVIYIVVLGPIAEEFLFRGLILRGFLSRYSVRKAILASAILFGLSHINPFQIVTATVIGILFAWWRVKTGSLLPSLIGHALNNALAVGALRFHWMNIRGFAGASAQGTLQPLWFDLTGGLLFAVGMLQLVRTFRSFEDRRGPSAAAPRPGQGEGEAADTRGRTAAPPVKTVLFVCVENTFRSVLSEAIFNADAPAGWRAESAGVQPASAINPVVIELLREIGAEIQPKTPALVTREQIAAVARVITFGCLDRCPAGVEGKSEDWSVPGATGKTPQELRVIRDELRHRIAILIERIRTRESS